jgi:glycosyltransferase involved in cell wall biosynthesis
MPVTIRPITDGEHLGFARGSAVVCIPIVLADSQTLISVRSVVEHSGGATPIVVAGTSTLLTRIAEELAAQALARTLLGLVVTAGTEVQIVNAMMRASFPADVVLVVRGIHVTSGWLERLRAAATSDSTIASATPLSLGAGAVKLLHDERCDSANLPAHPRVGEISREEDQQKAADDFDEAAGRVLGQTLKLRPRIATMGPGCAYIRRVGLDLAGRLDESLALGAALARLALRAQALGMVHVAADDVLVEGFPVRLRAPDEVSASPTQDAIQETIASDEHGPLRRVMNRARVGLDGLSVTIDARALVFAVGGTQTYVLGLILALARQPAVAVRVLVPPDLSMQAADALRSAPGIGLLSYEQAIEGAPLTDVVHRPQQVFTPDDLTLLRLVGERVVIGQQDLIAYHNHAYHAGVDSWRSYRRTTRLALAGADQVVFFSEHARRDALAEDLLQTGRTHVVGIATGALEPSTLPGTAPAGLPADEPFLLCLGADYAHKNRPFAIELLGALRELGWRGRLVLAGAHVPHGSSREQELDLVSASPDLARLVLDLGPVDEPSKQWLYRHARALVYPTVYEGFGLLPFEAAHADLPCLFAAQASLSELAGDAATLVAWDPRASATAVLPLLSDGPARNGHLAKLRALQIPSWGEVASRLVTVYEHALAAPPSEAAPRAWQELDRESYIVRLDRDIGHLKQLAHEYQDAYHALEARVSAGLPLIDEGGLLTPAQQRGLMRVAARRGLGAAVLTPFALLGRLDRGSGSGR